MAFGGSNKGGSIADINVTPLVDVLLVLLIIFMVTAPMIHHGARVPTPDVTPSDPKQQPPPDQQKGTLFVDQKGQISFRDRPVTFDQLFQTLKQDSEIQRTSELYLQADASLSYGQVMAIIATMRRAGVKKLGVVVEPDDLK